MTQAPRRRIRFSTSNGDFHLKNDCESELFFYPDATLRKVNTFPRRFRK